MFEPERALLVFMRAGEFGSRSGLARSGGYRPFQRNNKRGGRSDRGRLFFGYFLLAKQKKVPRLRFGNRNYNILLNRIAPTAQTDLAHAQKKDNRARHAISIDARNEPPHPLGIRRVI